MRSGRAVAQTHCSKSKHEFSIELILGEFKCHHMTWNSLRSSYDPWRFGAYGNKITASRREGIRKKNSSINSIPMESADLPCVAINFRELHYPVGPDQHPPEKLLPWRNEPSLQWCLQYRTIVRKWWQLSGILISIMGLMWLI